MAQLVQATSHTSSDVEKLMKRLNLTSLGSNMAAKKDVGSIGNATQRIITNIHGLKVPNALRLYRYDVTIQAVRDGIERVIDLTKKARSDAVVTNRKDLCRSIFITAIAEHADVFGPADELCYDLQSTLFCPKLLTENPDGVTFDVTNEDVVRQLPAGSRAQIKIKPVKETRVLDASELTRLSSDLDEVDHSLQQYLELETSQAALMDGQNHITYPGGKSFLMHPENHGFTARDAPALGHGKYLGIGCQKSIRYIEGPRGPGNKRVGVVIDTKKTPFHTSMPLVTAAQGIINFGNRELTNHEIDLLKTAFMGLSAQTLHEGIARTITIHSISTETAESKRINWEGHGEVSVTEYFAQKYNVHLQFPRANLVVESGPQKSEFPMEVLQISDNQRVRTEHQTPELVQNMIRACAVPPSILIPQNDRNGRALGLFGANRSPHLAAMDIDVVEKPVTVNTRVLPPPYILYGNGNTATPEPSRATWGQRAHYLVPCDLGKWAIYVLGSMPPRNRSRFEENECRQFLGCFQQQCIRVGVPYVPPAYMGAIPINADRLKEEFEACKKDGFTFMFFIHADNDQSLHKVVKLFERQYEIVTQLVKMQNAGDIVSKGKQQTMENIIHKTNVKLGGVNYELRLPEDGIAQTLGNDILCIGLSLNHPGAINPTLRTTVGMAPTIVGYAANDKIHPFEFVGGFRLQKPSKEERVTVLGEIVEECFKRFHASRGHFPKKLIIFRNGCSEGQFKMVLATEIPFALGAIRDLGCDAKVTVVVPNRLHNLRFMLEGANVQQRPPEQNVRPGTIIDTVVVHPSYNEFYLNPHVALQGTAKTPRFTVLHDDNDLSNDAIQLLCYTLCFGHQIVRLPTSLPSPVYIATRYAERGRALLNASSNLVEVAGADAFVQLAQQLPYYHSEALRDLRINA